MAFDLAASDFRKETIADAAEDKRPRLLLEVENSSQLLELILKTIIPDEDKAVFACHLTLSRQDDPAGIQGLLNRFLAPAGHIECIKTHDPEPLRKTPQVLIT
jgi:hypothetical protein